MTNPTMIEIPLPENLPLIDKAFSYAAIHKEENEWDLETWPGVIGDDLVAALESPIVSKLLAILYPAVKGVVVKSLEDLALCAQNNKAKFLEDADDENENVEGFTDEHLQAFLLQRATYAKHIIDWRNLARLFNESSPQEQAAIDLFFWEFHRLAFQDLFKHKGLDLPVPAALLENIETRKDGDETFIHCKLADFWLRDDAFCRQFHVSSVENLTNSITTIGYAGTLEQAIAKASLYAMDKVPFEQKINKLGNIIAVGGRPNSITIWLDREVVAKADRKVVGNPGEQRLLWGKCTSNRITDNQFKKALYSTEKLLGVQWSKAYHLEDALGL
jgi:macrodomain Ter protein organizer (MatP/YcbG family)